ncbi:hypothetical protein HELRODRAFT_116136 [Helobdella robusta]|uniref:Paired amphipathic helix protein Sin3b n=1 Tax=Helobdella robusta TaxID=6412 RepID=T1EGD2_HELRO|nr:hypothetical protein HELRODRAFT_116136 [Helobdella robusta]ESN92146.1 hypothetical protein HELRODRAFT_116136 [Helobdella robusta]
MHSPPQQQSFSRLKVEDALSYLDRVKQQFCTQPQVYNDFLDIMKEFKSQTIDTPGVIARVSHLFHGHKDLIVGFNTFLPLGYKIELNKATDTISIYQPESSRTHHHHHQHDVNMDSLPPMITDSVTGQPVEFNHAITYVNKIKHRYQNRPDIYKSFLEILHNYQNEQRISKEQPNAALANKLMEGEVYKNVAVLFADQPDLLQEFSQFLPDASGGGTQNPAHTISNSGILNSVPGSGSFGCGLPANQGTASYMQQQQLQQYNNSSNISSSNSANESGLLSLCSSTISKKSSAAAAATATSSVATAAANQASLPSAVAAAPANNSSSYNNNNMCGSSSNNNVSGSSGTVAGSRKKRFGSGGNLSNAVSSRRFKSDTYSSSSNNNNNNNSSSNAINNTNNNSNNNNNNSSSSGTASQKHMSELSRYGSLGDFAFFDKVRSSLGEHMYHDFLKCLKLYNIPDMKMSSAELMQMIHPFCLKMPELKKRMRVLLNQKDETLPSSSSSSLLPNNSNNNYNSNNYNNNYNNASGNSNNLDGIMANGGFVRSRVGEYAGEIDYASCKRYDISYLSLPKDHIHARCSGRTAMCYEVLNDTHVSFPSWSEDSSSVIKKTMAEEMIFRCEEERYQLDIILENMQSTLDVMRFVQWKMENMTCDERSKFKLDANLGGRSECLHRKTIQGLYGNAASTIVEALRNKPSVAVPVIIRRLEDKVAEWREAKAKNSLAWNEQNQKYYLKSLDHAGLNFKQLDSKLIRSKTLLLEIENNYEKEGTPPHLTLPYNNEMTFVSDAFTLTIHNVKRQSNIHHNEKKKMKQLLQAFLPDFFAFPREAMSDDEVDENASQKDFNGTTASEKISNKNNNNNNSNNNNNNNNQDSQSRSFFVNQNWYIFMRLHFLLSDRLRQFSSHAQKMVKDREVENQMPFVQSTAMSLGLRGAPPDPANSYSQLLKLIISYLDGHIEAPAYEEQLRELFLTNAYVAFTVDKLIQNIVRQLQHIATDELCIRLAELYNNESKSSTSQGAEFELAYQKKAERLLAGDNCYKLFIVSWFSGLWVAISVSLIGSSDCFIVLDG